MDLNGAFEGSGPPSKTRIDVFNSKRSLTALFIAYILAFALLCGLGSTGPEVFNRVAAKSKDGDSSAKYWTLLNPGCEVGDCKFSYDIPIIHMIPEMQLIYMKVQVQRPSGTAALSAGVLTTTSVIGCDREHCSPGGLNFDGEQVRDESDSTSVEWDAEETWSKNFSLFTTDPDPITYNQYNVSVVLTDTSGKAAYYSEGSDPKLAAKADMVFVNPDFTWWVMGWKMVFLVGTVIVMFSPITKFNGAFAGFFVQQRNVKLKDWSLIQTWIGALLVVLLFFNDPFFPLQFGDGVSPGVKQFLVMQSIVFVALFVSMMLCFMLVSTGTIIRSNKDQFMGESAARHKLRSNTIIAKVGLCSLIFAFLFFYYVIARMYNTGSPQYDDFSEEQAYMSFEIILILCMVVFSLWYIVSVCRCIMNVQMIERGYLALLVITVILAILMVVGVSIGALFVLPQTPFKWMFFYGSCNVTVWVLGWAFAHAAEEDDTESSWAMDSVGKEGAGYSSLLGGEEPLGGGAEGLLSADI
ncbi:hypothetical protein TrST_g13724 [Triparma strigata]|uniref:Wntless-like transmembrane domain-containing protein n=1 Tax=Triparma strigata TaxID=1606541 RepID=A0A9W7BUR3_9STRA|nr:hypothetical protein TrST_g13724 [Triparma strigata]